MFICVERFRLLNNLIIAIEVASTRIEWGARRQEGGKRKAATSTNTVEFEKT